jgi:very-short-patch-repair endonuclease
VIPVQPGAGASHARELPVSGPGVLVEISGRRTWSLALQAAGVPLLDGVLVRNLGWTRLEGMHLFLSLEVDQLAVAVDLVVPTVYPGEEVAAGPVEMRLAPESLALVRAPMAGRLSWRLTMPDRELERGELPVDLLPWDEWPGDRAPVSVLAQFVAPDDPVVGVLVRRLSSASSAAEPPAARAAALFGAIRALGIAEAELPPSFEATGLRVRFPSSVLVEQRANGMELALLCCACLERMGLCPLLLSAGGRVLPGAWLVDDRFPEGVVHDLPRLRGAAGQLLWFDPRYAAPEGGSWEESLRAARALVQDEGAFRWLLDVRALRMEGLAPLGFRPKRELQSKDGGHKGRPVVHEILAEAASAGAAPAPRQAPAPDEPVSARFRQWKDRLLDLSLRNRLLAFRMDARTTLPLEVPDLPRFVDLLSERTGHDTGFALGLEVLPRPPLPGEQHSAESTTQTLLPGLQLEPPPDDSVEDAPTEEVETITLQRVPLPTQATPAQGTPAAAPAGPVSLLEQGKVRSTLLADECFARAVGLDRVTRTDLEEGGANTLFVAVGFLRWSEGGGPLPTRHAPLLLVPVTIEVHRASRTVRLRRLPEDPIPNVTLVEKLRRDFDLDLSGITGFESEEHAIDIVAVLQAAREAIAPMKAWEVVEGAALGQFVFTKFLLWRDLEDNARKLLENPVVQHIARQAHVPYPNPVPAPDPAELDQKIAPAALPIVLDADSTQMAAIYGALQGRSFVLQGPPGTGKSQTITNLVAAAIASGRTVLVVAEKMAALEVVHRRLKECGLGDLCLELHSHKTHKRQVITALATALKREPLPGRVPWEQRSAELQQSRDELNAYVSALHVVRQDGTTFYGRAARQLGLRDGRAVQLPIPDPARLSEEQVRDLAELVARFATAGALVEPVPEHPWRDAWVEGWSPNAEQALLSKIGKALDVEQAAQSAAEELGPLLGLEPSAVASPERLEKLAALGNDLARGTLPPASTKPAEAEAFAERVRNHAGKYNTWQARSRTVAQRWHPPLYEHDLERLHQSFATWASAWFPIAFVMLFFARRELKRVVRKYMPENRAIATDLSLALEVDRAREPLAEERKALMAASRGTWPGTEPEELVKLTERAEQLLEHLGRVRAFGLPVTDGVLSFVDPATSAERRKALTKRSAEAARLVERFKTSVGSAFEAAGAARPRPDQPFVDARDRLSRWQQHSDRFRNYALYCGLAAELRRSLLGPLVELHLAGQLPARELPAVFERSLGQQWLDAVLDAEPALRDFSGPERHRQVARFQRLDRQHLQLGRHQVLASVDQRAPRLTAEVAEASEPGILLREAAKKTRQKSVRRLLQEIPNLLARLKPCLLMSPLSVAQYLPADGRRFDLVVFDEASQIGTHDAIGALARGNQVVVVGDSRQLPPTTFFQRAGGEDSGDENDFDELESILDEAVAAGLPEQMLGWHYRSRHEALIRFSNDHYYGGRLAVFPAARGRTDDLGISWHPIEGGVYDKARTRTNRAEARALVDHLVGSLLRTSPQVRTFGVVTFSQAQQALVSDLLDEARRTRPEIERHFAHDEPVFVKNLENVQGDERDEILFSIGYGPDERGRVWMNFGPLNREGGERRLNVAVTRARRQLRVFSTLTHHHIDLSRTRARGARHLKEFLRYAAEQGTSALDPDKAETPAGQDFPTLLEREVHDALVARGHRVGVLVGCGEYRIDLAVLHPETGQYLLGVELDGESYRKAATARDRDRLRAAVLEGLGWRLHRIWSIDWWFSREEELERLEVAIAEALEGTPPPAPEPEEPLVFERAATPPPVSEAHGPAPAHQAPAPVEPRTESYVEAAPSLVSADVGSLHDAELFDELRRVVQQVLDVEGPIHIALLTRRVGAAFGLTKLTERAKKRVLAAARKLVPQPSVRGSFLWPVGLDPAGWERVRVGSRDPEHLPPEEVAAAVAMVLQGNLAMPKGDLVKETGKVFGMSRVGKKGVAAMEAGIAVLIDRGGAEMQDEDRVVGKG